MLVDKRTIDGCNALGMGGGRGGTEELAEFGSGELFAAMKVSEDTEIDGGQKDLRDHEAVTKLHKPVHDCF